MAYFAAATAVGLIIAIHEFGHLLAAKRNVLLVRCVRRIIVVLINMNLAVGRIVA